MTASFDQIKYATSVLLVKSGVQNWLKNVYFNARKSAIQMLSSSFRSQIIKSNQRFLEKNLIKKGSV